MTAPPSRPAYGGGVPADDVAEEIDAQLRARGTPERAVSEKAYLKSDLEFYGSTVPAMQAVVKQIRRAHPELQGRDWVPVALALWSRPVNDRRMAAVELLESVAGSLDATDAPMLERLLRESRTWALVDSLAASVVGDIALRDRRMDEVLDRWAADDDFWIRRSALLALLIPLRTGGGDFERFGRYADAMLGETEFFIRKAIGWVLRDTAKKRPDLVFEWLLPRAARASGLTVREAAKRLSPEQREAVLAAHKA